MSTFSRAGARGSGTPFRWQSSKQGGPMAQRPGRRESHAGWACGGGGVGRQALLFPSYDPRARGGAGAEGPEPWPPIRWQHPAGPWGLGPGSGRAPADAAASWECPPVAAQAAASPQSSSGGWLSPASRTSSCPLHQTAASVCGISWARRGTGTELQRLFIRGCMPGLPGSSAPVMAVPFPSQLQSHEGGECGKGTPSP